MSNISRAVLYVAFFQLFLLTACTSTDHDNSLQYPLISAKEMEEETANCEAVDHRLRQVDSIRWSLREDGTELETDFEQMVQLSLASAAAIAIAVPLFSLGVPPPELVLAPYAATFTASDLLKRTDALLIAILTKREELQCPPHHECAIQNDQGDTLTDLRSVRKQVESEAITEEEGIRKLTKLLDGLCPVSDPGLHRLSDEGS